MAKNPVYLVTQISKPLYRETINTAVYSEDENEWFWFRNYKWMFVIDTWSIKYEYHSGSRCMSLTWNNPDAHLNKTTWVLGQPSNLKIYDVAMKNLPNRPHLMEALRGAIPGDEIAEMFNRRMNAQQ